MAFGTPFASRLRSNDPTAQCAGELPSAKSRRSKMTYWPTTPLTREQMTEALRLADQQDEAVLEIFRHHAGNEMAPSEVWTIGIVAGRSWLLTSVRRSITKLTNLQRVGAGRTASRRPQRSRAWRLPLGEVTS